MEATQEFAHHNSQIKGKKLAARKAGGENHDEAAEEAGLNISIIHIYSMGILLWEERNDAHSPHLPESKCSHRPSLSPLLSTGDKDVFEPYHKGVCIH